MKNICIIVLGIVLIFSVITTAFSADVVLDNGGVTFSPPAGFSEMPVDVVRKKYPNENRPQYLYGNEDYSVSIGVKFTENLLEINELRNLKMMMEDTLPRVIPNLEWISRRIMEINKRKWLLLELKSSAIDADIHNIMLSTSYKGKMLSFNFNSTVEQFKKNQKKLLNSIFSIKINENAP